METELRNLKSESTQMPSLFDRVKSVFSESKPTTSSGKLDMRPQSYDDDIESMGLIKKQS
jgi:hypothetical protein